MSYSLAWRSGFVALLTICAAACGGGSAADPDGATARNHRLVVLDPPGESIGLAYGASISLRVRYESESGVPLSGRAVSFSLTPSGNGGTGGASLSALQAVTDGAGVAAVNLTAGAEQIEYRVVATATDAPAVSFYIGVSSTGFAELILSASHQGWHDLDVFGRIEVRLYRASDLRCADLDADAPPISPFPQRTLPAFGARVSYENMIAYMPYTLVGWAVGPDDVTALAVGCIDLSAETLPPRRFELELVIHDRSPAWPDSIALRSTLDMASVTSAVADSAPEALWQVLSCPAGPGQLLLDCAVDASLDDGALDCVVNAAGPLRTAVESKRGALDANGCRPALLPGNVPTIDKLLTDAVGGSFPSGAALAQLLQRRSDVLAGVRIDSLLSFYAPGVVSHRLVSATVGSGAAQHVVALAASARPIVDQSQVAYALNGARDVGFSQHGYTLRWGSVCRDGFEQLALTPAGLSGKGDQLGSQLAAAISDGATGTSGCEAVSNIACDAAGQAPGCLQLGCGQAQLALDVALASWWRQLDGDAIDLVWSGTAPARDDDLDLLLDRVGTDPGDGGPGLWQAVIGLADGSSVGVTGTFISFKKVP